MPREFPGRCESDRTPASPLSGSPEGRRGRHLRERPGRRRSSEASSHGDNGETGEVPGMPHDSEQLDRPRVTFRSRRSWPPGPGSPRTCSRPSRSRLSFSSMTRLRIYVTGNGALVPHPSFDPSTLKCSNTYCHGTWMILKSSAPASAQGVYADTATVMAGANASPAWNAGSASGACSSCHGQAPSTYTPAGHISYALSACYLCHGDVVDQNGNILNQSKHMNGVIDLVSAVRRAEADEMTGGIDPYYCRKDAEYADERRIPGPLLSGEYARSALTAGGTGAAASPPVATARSGRTSRRSSRRSIPSSAPRSNRTWSSSGRRSAPSARSSPPGGPVRSASETECALDRYFPLIVQVIEETQLSKRLHA